MNKSCDVLVIGGGAAGLSAAVAAQKQGVKTLIIEREDYLGGILQQCIHNGFGLHRFGEELCGPEYAQKDIDAVHKLGIDYLLETSALKIDACDGIYKVDCVSAQLGLVTVVCKSIVLACGCRERTRGQINIAGSRPAGVFSAGSAQKLINHDGALVGKRVVILGSGDIGLIMARRMTWEGAQVLCVLELMDQPGGLRRNIVQCLEDYNIELKLSTTVTRIIGKDRLEAVEVAEVDPNTYAVKENTKRIIECDCLLLSVGLIPENGIAKAAGVKLDPKTAGPCVTERLETSRPGIFVAGNELHVHDLADYVSEEGQLAGQSAAAYVKGDAQATQHCIEVQASQNVGSVTPQIIGNLEEPVVCRLRVKKPLKDAYIQVLCGDELVYQTKKRVAIPSEMLSFTLKPKQLQKITGNIDICVSEQKR